MTHTQAVILMTMRSLTDNQPNVWILGETILKEINSGRKWFRHWSPPKFDQNAMYLSDDGLIGTRQFQSTGRREFCLLEGK